MSTPTLEPLWADVPPPPNPGRNDPFPPATGARRRVLLMAVAVVAVVLTTVLATRPGSWSWPYAPCGGACEFSSSGSADLHAFDRNEGVLHVLYLDSSWTDEQLRDVRTAAGAWRQTVTVMVPGPDARVAVDHWGSDLPAAQVHQTTEDSSITVTVTAPALDEVRPGRLYRTQVLLRSPRDLDGAQWSYHEQIGRTPSDGMFVVDASSTPRHGVGGWCANCFVQWDHTPGEQG